MQKIHDNYFTQILFVYLVYPRETCRSENNRIDKRTGQMNNSFAAANVITFYYACDHEGNYKPLQYYGVKGIQWCVNPITGHISEGKKAPTGQHLDCSAENKLKNTSNQTSGQTSGQISPTQSPPEPSKQKDKCKFSKTSLFCKSLARLLFLKQNKSKALKIETSSSNFSITRSRHQRGSIKKGVLKNFEILTGKHLYQGLFLRKLQASGLQSTFFREHLWAFAFS